MRDLPGVNDLFEPQHKFNKTLREAVERGRKAINVENYIALISGAKTINEIEDPTVWVGVKESETELQREEDER